MPNDNDRLNLLLDLRRFADAETAAREMIARNPDAGAGYVHLARALINLNRKDEAIAAAREGVRKAPRDAWAVGTLACALNWFGDSRGALEPAEEAVRLDPRYPWAYAMLANILFNMNRFADALERAVEGLKYDPLHESLFRWKGWAEHKLGRHAEALATADEGLKHHPNSHLIMNLIGCIRWALAETTWGQKRLRGHREADDMIRTAVRLDPKQVAYRDNLRSNALSCRRYLIAIILPALAFVLVVFPIGLLAWTVIRARNVEGAVAAVVVAVIACLLVGIAASTSYLVHVAPLAWWNVPSFPLTDKEKFGGRVDLCTLVVVLAIPYVVVAGVLAWG